MNVANVFSNKSQNNYFKVFPIHIFKAHCCLPCVGINWIIRNSTKWRHFTCEIIFLCDLPCDTETAGLEQLRESAIRDEPPGDSDESSRCLLFIFVTVPQFVEVFVDALLLSAININMILISLCGWWLKLTTFGEFLLINDFL